MKHASRKVLIRQILSSKREAKFFYCVFMDQAPVAQRVDNAIQRINHYPVDSVVCFANTYPLDNDLSGG